MKKLSLKGITNSVQNAAIDGAVLYAGKKGAQILNTQLARVLPATFTGPLRAIAVGALGVVAADAILPKRYASLVSAAVAMEIVEAFASPVVDPMLLSSGLLYLPAASATTATATQGYTRMAGYASVRGGMGLFPPVNALGLAG